MNRIWFWLILLCLNSLSPCQSQDAAPHSEHVKLSLIAQKKSLGQDSTQWIGLRAQLAPGWKTYWRSPGVAGYAVRLNWEGVENIKEAQIHWPLPHHFQSDFGTVNVYEGDFVLPISVEVLDLSKPVQGDVKVDLLVCDLSLCIPVRQTLHINLPVGPGDDNAAQAQQILKARNQVPLTENHSSSRCGSVRK
jgi:suppressor for copper-sensitivity B